MIRKTAIWFSIIFIAVITIILILLHSVSGYLRGNDKTLETTFKESNYHYSLHHDTLLGHDIRWFSTGDNAISKTILFFHGAPGSWQDFSEYLVDSYLQDNVQMIVMDRPGYGYSDYGKAQTSISIQADIAHEIVKSTKVDSLILVGYSYGGPVAGAYAGKYTERVSSVLLLAPVVAPLDEKIFWFNYVIDFPLLHWIFPRYIQVANEEKLSHSKALHDISHEWTNITAPVIHLHCTDDWIAPYTPNTQWTQDNINGQIDIVHWTGDSHFLPNNIYKRVLPILKSLVAK